MKKLAIFAVDYWNEMSESERQQVMQEMASFDGEAFEPMVGIFWYSPERHELFDIKSIPASQLARGTSTLGMLHKDVWAKNFYRARAKGQTDSIYFTDYTQIPRGRVFCDETRKIFSVRVGHWIEGHEEEVRALVMDEFNLRDFRFDIDSHWDLGHGWSEKELHEFKF